MEAADSTYQYSAQPAKIRVADLKGYPRRLAPKDFATAQFDTRGPAYPVNQKIQIIAVAGPSDVDDNAHPEADGWFLSDFYLFHHLFNRLLATWGDKASPRVNQKWLTCVDPADLVRKYKVFAHGNPNDRRVVLDESMLKKAREAVYVASPKDLRSTFLATVERTCKECAAENRPVLILLFGHGRASDGGVYLGIDDDERKNLRTLHIDEVARAVGAHASKTTILSTACFSGRWSEDPRLQTATLTAAEPAVESLAHSRLSIGDKDYGPTCGSVFATAVRLALQATEAIEANSRLTFAALVAQVRWEMSNEVDGARLATMSGAARDDAWQDVWWRQSTLPLLYDSWNMKAGTFAQEWQALAPYTGTLLPPSPFAIAGTGKEAMSTKDRTALRDVATLYLNSHPGPPEVSGNNFAGSLCLRLVRGDIKGDTQFPVRADTGQRLLALLRYRLYEVMHRATAYKNHLGLITKVVDCEDYDAFTKTTTLSEAVRRATESERRATTDAARQSAATARAKADAAQGRYSTIFERVAAAELFPPPKADQGHAYAKGDAYIAHAMCDAEWNDVDVNDAIEKLKQLGSLNGRP